MAKVRETTLDEFEQDPENANVGTKAGAQLLENSFAQHRAGRSLLADAEGVLIAGNKSQKAAQTAGLEKVVVVETDGTEIVVVQRTDLHQGDPERESLALFDNRTSEIGLRWNPSAIKAKFEAGVDLSKLWNKQQLDRLVEQAQSTNEEIQADDRFAPYAPDALFLSDNEWGVPVLNKEVQADFLELPVTKWGDGSRRGKMRGTYHFYTDDYKFSALWKDPCNLINSQCVAMIEPNCSTNDQMPMAVALWGIYRKRWIARYAQENGIKVWVDLNVDPKFRDLNLLGIPSGWQAYATRGLDKFIELILADYECACECAAPESPRFLVYGGGKQTEALCQDRGWMWVPENMHVKDGRRDG